MWSGPWVERSMSRRLRCDAHANSCDSCSVVLQPRASSCFVVNWRAYIAFIFLFICGNDPCGGNSKYEPHPSLTPHIVLVWIHTTRHDEGIKTPRRCSGLGYRTWELRNLWSMFPKLICPYIYPPTAVYPFLQKHYTSSSIDFTFFLATCKYTAHVGKMAEKSGRALR